MRLSAFGDVVHALPVLSGLKALLPTAQVTWLVKQRWAPLLEGQPGLERVLQLPGASRSTVVRSALLPWRFPRSAWRFLRTLREGDFDLALDLQGSPKSGFLARASGARCVLGAHREHTRAGQEVFVRRGLRLPVLARHKVERGLALLASVLGQPVPYVAPPFPLEDADRHAAAEALRAAGAPGSGALVLHPGTSEFGRFKRWPPDRFAALARRLADRERPAAVTYGPGERILAEAVVREADGRAVTVATGSLRTLAALLASARLVVAGDTGPLHLAALLGVPVLGLYGPKDPAVYGPYGLSAAGAPGPLPVVVRTDVACRPCTLRRCDAPLCLTGLEPEVVATAAAALERP